MKIKALGVNGAFTKNYHNNYVFELGEEKLLVDAGTTLRYSLPAAGYKESDITDIIITHLHSDHVGGLEEFAQRCKWIYNHKPTLWIREEMLPELKEVVGNGLFTDGLGLEDYFEVNFGSKYNSGYYGIGHYLVQPIVTDNLHAQGMKSMGFRINDPVGWNLVFSSDIAKHEQSQIKNFIDEDTFALFHDVSVVPNAVHSYLNDVVDYYQDVIDLSKIYGMHYQDDTNIVELSKELGINFVQKDENYEFKFRQF